MENIEELKEKIKYLEKKLRKEKFGIKFERENDEKVFIESFSKIPTFEIDENNSIKKDNSNENVLIEGDNYESLLALNYVNEIDGTFDVIYIDPPYNTGNKDFIYNDSIVDSNDLFKHSKWLSFMEKRLILSRRLLNEDGVIFISIDHREVFHLKLLCDNIFGERNFITQFVWEKTQHVGRQKSNYYSNTEYILCYAKQLINKDGNIKNILVEYVKDEFEDAPLYNNSNKENEIIFPSGSVDFKIKDGKYKASIIDNYEVLNDVVVENGVNKNDLKMKFRSRWSQDMIYREIEKGTRFLVKSDKFAIRTVYYEGKVSFESPKQLIMTNKKNELCTISRFKDEYVSTTETGTSDLEKNIGKSEFKYPKPVSLIKYLISLFYSQSVNDFRKDIKVLDFFAGSGTTGQAVMELNKLDGGNRKFVLCTNNENNICQDITLKRLSEFIKKNNANESVNYFRIYNIDSDSFGDELKIELSTKIREFLSIKHNCFEYFRHNESFFELKNSRENSKVLIYDDIDYTNIDVFYKMIEKDSNAIKIIYIFSFNENIPDDVIEKLSNHKVLTLPNFILKIDKNIKIELESELCLN